MTREEIINVLQDDKTIPFIQPDQLANIVDFVSENYKPSLPDGLEEAAGEYASDSTGFIDMTAYKAFIVGAEWQKDQPITDNRKDKLDELHDEIRRRMSARCSELESGVRFTLIGRIAEDEELLSIIKMISRRG